MILHLDAFAFGHNLSDNTEILCKIVFNVLNYKNKNNFVGKYRQIRRKTNTNKLVVLLYIYGF